MADGDADDDALGRLEGLLVLDGVGSDEGWEEGLTVGITVGVREGSSEGS